jgi:hypothetical protein
VSHAERLQQLDGMLLASCELWHAQPFREIHPAWCDRWPELHQAVLALGESDMAHLADDSQAALQFLVPWFPLAADIGRLSRLQAASQPSRPRHAADKRWAWEIPGRKQQQIEAFHAAVQPVSRPVLDWCGGKGHLGRLLALQWQVPVQTLEIDAVLCQAGAALARRLSLVHGFIAADALSATDCFAAGPHAVALHACGHLHRTLLRQGVLAGLAGFDVAPCCYHIGVAGHYPAFSENLQLRLTADDSRLAVTETVTASPRLQRQRDLEMAWKLGFDVLRRQHTGDAAYRPFKPVPAAWFRDGFETFLQRMFQREGWAWAATTNCAEFERRGWERQRQVMRLSIVRSAFRRAIEVWMALDMASFLECAGYSVRLETFCERAMTPRNLLLSGR